MPLPSPHAELTVSGGGGVLPDLSNYILYLCGLPGMGVYFYQNQYDLDEEAVNKRLSCFQGQKQEALLLDADLHSPHYSGPYA